MSYRELHYHWEYDLRSSPEQLWPFVSDTNRFNRDAGVPAVEPTTKKERLKNARRRLRLSVYGMNVEWEEQPFEWVRPSRFGVARTYSKGPMRELRALAQLEPKPSGGTKLSYDVFVKPRSLAGALIVALQFRFVSGRRFARAFHSYDEMAAGAMPARSNDELKLSPAALERIEIITQRLAAESDRGLIEHLVRLVEYGDDFAVARIRPYELADKWNVPRRNVLELCLRATRAGLLDLQWELLCPLCRGAKQTGESLSEISSELHCETCRIDFKVNFDRFVEVTFRPNPTLRLTTMQDFCMGSPQHTPHIVAQQLLPAGSWRELNLPLETGSYRMRALELSGGLDVAVTKDNGTANATIKIDEAGWPHEQLKLSSVSSLRLENQTAAEQLLILERLAWTDQAATAAEVTALQTFRDLFSTEALRPGEQISVGTLTVLFTDLRDSTRLYREIGDATAFGRVMNHFDVLKRFIAEEDGALVKTIGDAVMAIFRRPAGALKAMLGAQKFLAEPPNGMAPLTLKAGIHEGPCIAVTLNDRLDYFGSTVNMAARLEGLSTGNDVVISGPIYDDPEVRALIQVEKLEAVPFEMMLKGFDEQQFQLWRVRKAAAEER
ncbi:MAG TPA: DUF5939 domain-containing protein [Pyrinomonadaceae bacterium]|nr:DUF5939 domain-containing protein [Pyrinomonadaceae bacterium]